MFAAFALSGAQSSAPAQKNDARGLGARLWDRLSCAVRRAGIAACAALAFGFAAVPAQAQGLLRDTEIEGTLRELTDPILEVAGLQPSQVNLYLVNDPTLNAFVAGGQNIFFHSGFLIEVSNINELQGVIAHEVGHIAGGHLARFASDAGKAGALPTIVAIGLGALAIAAGAPDAGAALIAGSSQFGIIQVLGYRQDQEASADQSAVTYLRTLGLPIDGLVSFMDRFRDLEAFSGANRYPYFRTHPLASTRVTALQNQALRFPVVDHAPDPAMQARFELMQAKLIGFLQPMARVKRRYPESDTSTPSLYARAIASFQAGDIERSLVLTEELTNRDPVNPFFHELRGQSLFETGRLKESIAPHRQANVLAPREPLLLINLARSLIAVSDKPNSEEVIEAESLLRIAVAEDPTNGFAWSQLAIAYDRLGRPGDARLAAAEAAYTRGDRPQALSFARRAQAELDEGSPAYLRASDIAALADPRNRFADGQFR